MGGGSYSYSNSSSRARSLANNSREAIFSNRMMSADMNIHGKVRESCDSDEHPESFPIIIGFDVTGSMGFVPELLIKGVFPEVMKNIMANGINHAQVCFVAFGDAYSDDAPIQVGQFETSDELQDKWLKSSYLESGGGGNGGESANLVHFFAARCTKIDSFKKRGIKGILITISDERTHGSISKIDAESLFGINIEKTQIATSEILKEASESWNIYHINIEDYSSTRQNALQQWEELLGKDNVFNVDEDNVKSQLSEILATIIAKGSTINITSIETVPSVEANSNDNHLL